jgi:hypothetical protein
LSSKNLFTFKNGNLIFDGQHLINVKKMMDEHVQVADGVKFKGSDVNTTIFVADIITLFTFFPDSMVVWEKFASTISGENTSDMADPYWLLFYVFMPCCCLATIVSYFGYKAIGMKNEETTKYATLSADFWKENSKSRAKLTQTKYYNMAFAAFVMEYLQFLSYCNTQSAKPNHQKLGEIAKLLQTETKDSIRRATTSKRKRQSDSNSKSTKAQKSPSVSATDIACLRPGLDAGSTNGMIRNNTVDMELSALLLTYPVFVYNQMKSLEKKNNAAFSFKTMYETIKPEKSPDQFVKGKDNTPLSRHLTLKEILGKTLDLKQHSLKGIWTQDNRYNILQTSFKVQQVSKKRQQFTNLNDLRKHLWQQFYFLMTAFHEHKEKKYDKLEDQKEIDAVVLYMKQIGNVERYFKHMSGVFMLWNNKNGKRDQPLFHLMIFVILRFVKFHLQEFSSSSQDCSRDKIMNVYNTILDDIKNSVASLWTNEFEYDFDEAEKYWSCENDEIGYVTFLWDSFAKKNGMDKKTELSTLENLTRQICFETTDGLENIKNVINEDNKLKMSYSAIADDYDQYEDDISISTDEAIDILEKHSGKQSNNGEPEDATQNN